MIIEVTNKLIIDKRSRDWCKLPYPNHKNGCPNYGIKRECPPNPTFDGLNTEWKESNFVNPPYGREIGKWIKKAYEESLKGKLVVMLIPSRTDTKWWHNYIMKAIEIRFIKGRLKFDNHKNSAPFPSCVVIFEGTG